MIGSRISRNGQLHEKKTAMIILLSVKQKFAKCSFIIAIAGYCTMPDFPEQQKHGIARYFGQHCTTNEQFLTLTP